MFIQSLLTVLKMVHNGYFICYITIKGERFLLKFRFWWLKIRLAISVFISKIVINFHKPLQGVAINKNIKYAHGKGNFHRLDICYPTNCIRLLKCLYQKRKKLVEAMNSSEEDPIKNSKPCIFFFHGGGWATLDKSMYETLCKRLARMGYVVFNCNYGLAPKNTLQDIMHDCLKAVSFGRMVAPLYGGDPNRIIFAGDSAGGHIAGYLSAMISSGKFSEYQIGKKLKATILIYGVFDLFALESSGQKDIDLYLYSIYSKTPQKKFEIFEKYSTKNLVSANFPHSLIISGGVDKLHSSQSLMFDKLLSDMNVAHEKLFFEEREILAFHGFMSIDGLGTNVKALSSIETFLKNVEGLK